MGERDKVFKMSCSKQKPIRIDRYEMPTNYSIEQCVDEAIKIANRSERGVSFEFDHIEMVVYPLCSKKIPDDKNTKEYYLQIFFKKKDR